MTGQYGPAAAWDADYAAGRYSDEPPVAFTRDILQAARQASLTRGLYIGCGNGRNYLPLVAGGLDLTGLDISAAAIAQLAARVLDRADRLVCGDLGAQLLRPPTRSSSGSRSSSTATALPRTPISAPRSG